MESRIAVTTRELVNKQSYNFIALRRFSCQSPVLLHHRIAKIIHAKRVELRLQLCARLFSDERRYLAGQLIEAKKDECSAERSSICEFDLASHRAISSDAINQRDPGTSNKGSLLSGRQCRRSHR